VPAPTLEISAEFIPKVQFLFEPWRYKVLWGGRNGVKSWSIARALLILGLNGRERVLCARELQKSLDESVHKLLADQISALQMNYLYDVQQAHILGRESAEGTSFSFEGLRHNTAKVKSYEGLTRCWVEEAAKLSKTSFNILVPTLRVQGSELWFSYNPELDDDFIHQFFVIQPPPPNAKVVKLTYRDNPWLTATTREEIQHLKETDYDEYLHVYEGQTKQVLDGAIYAEELRAARASDPPRLTRVPYDRSLPVNCYFDLGRSDHTSIWFEQRVGFEHHLIDFYQNRLKHIDHYLKVMQQRGYLYGLVWLPHDAKAKTLGTRMSIEEQVRAAGFQVRLVPKLSIQDRINAARTVFPVCYFDEQRCADGLHSLKHYKYEVKDGRFSQSPLHDWASDAADAFSYFGVASKQRVKAGPCGLELPESTRLGTLGELTLKLGELQAKANGWLGR
jgi:phage terminase large subunit